MGLSLSIFIKLSQRPVLYVVSDSVVITELNHTYSALIIKNLMLRKSTDFLAVIGSPEDNPVRERNCFQNSVQILSHKVWCRVGFYAEPCFAAASMESLK